MPPANLNLCFVSVDTVCNTLSKSVASINPVIVKLLRLGFVKLILISNVRSISRHSDSSVVSLQ